jgi:hypothetical protein
MSNNRIALVTGGDHRYYPLICELIASIKRFPQSSQLDIHVLDAGLTDLQKQKLTANGMHVFTPDWPNDEIAKRGKDKIFLKACVLRPFLNKLVPGYDTYIWMDGDTWLQDWSALDLYIRGAQLSGMACCTQAHHSWSRAMRISWLGPIPFRPRSFYYSNAYRAFGGAMARKLFAFNVFQAGVFAIAGNAPHWDKWQERILQALKRGKLFTAEQLTMGVMLHIDGYPVEILPTRCNWLCGNGLKWDRIAQRFTETYLPHQPIGIMHLCGFDDMRLDDKITIDVMNLEGQVQKMSLRFGPAYDGRVRELLDDLAA